MFDLFSFKQNTPLQDVNRNIQLFADGQSSKDSSVLIEVLFNFSFCQSNGFTKPRF